MGGTVVRQGRPQKLGLEGLGGSGRVAQGWSREGAEGLLYCRGAGWGAAPHPLPGLLQVIPQDFADLLFLVLGQCWQDALGRQGLGVDVPGITGHR